jgi:choline dehydrogenase-like flavoprotein
MGVRPTAPEVQGRRNMLFKDACEELGWSSEPCSRNETGCIGSGNCMTGCKTGAKQSMDRRGIPEVVAAGGTVYTSVRVDKVVIRGNQVQGIIGHTVDPKTRKIGHEVRITAGCTILSAGVIASPNILRRSGLTHAPIGGNLRLHPSAMMFGVFEDDVHPWVGATQGYHSTHFLESEGIKLESLWASASLLSLRLPGVGKPFKRYLSKYKRMAIWDAWVSGEDSIGRVRPLPAGQVDISYTLGKADVRRLQEANAKLAEMFAAVNASQVLTGLHGMPPMMEPSEAARTIREAFMDAKDVPTGSNHAFGTLAMGADPKQAATDTWGKVYGTENLYVADTSLFPASPSANPQLTAMALAHRLGKELPNRY